MNGLALERQVKIIVAVQYVTVGKLVLVILAVPRRVRHLSFSFSLA